MLLMLMIGYGITVGAMRFLLERRRPIQLKVIMLNYAIIWLVWLAVRVVFRAVPKHCIVPSRYLSLVSISANFSNSVSPIIRLMFFSSYKPIN